MTNVSFIKLVVFVWECAFSSLGEMSKQSVQFINGAAEFAKRSAARLQSLNPRDDGLTPKQIAARFRFRMRALIQSAILNGNALIARTAGL